MEKNQYVNTENIRIERLRQKKSYKEMSKLLGFKSPGAYCNIEKGITRPRIDIMIKVSNILKKPVEYFFNLKVQ